MKGEGERLRVCYAAPGHSLLGTAGSTRNILATAAALAEWAEVTVAFNRLAEPHDSPHYRVVSIDPAQDTAGAKVDDVAARGLNPLAHYRHVAGLDAFAVRHARDFDLVLEKGWRLSGCLARQFARRGVRVALVENDARIWDEPVRHWRTAARYAAHRGAQWLAARWSRSLPLVIAETPELKAALIAERGIRGDRIEVVPLGVDHARFRPEAQGPARAKLGLAGDACILLYVGGMDQYHDLSPLLEALEGAAPAGLEVHLVGDGAYAGRYREIAARARTPVAFHGQVPHEAIPAFIAASDACLAPYSARGFHGAGVYFSTLKIPEYMACERAVISVPSGNIRRLVQDGVTGILIPNEREAWLRLLTELPGRDRLAAMGRAAAPTVASLSWRETARRYLDLCARLNAGTSARIPG